MGEYDRPVWGGGAPLFGTGSAGFGTTWGGTNPSPRPTMPGRDEIRSLAGKGPRGYQRTDDRIHEEVCERLADHPDIDAGDIEVKVQDAEVILDGTVDDRRTKWMAEDCAAGVHGVRDVQNRLRLRIPVTAG